MQPRLMGIRELASNRVKDIKVYDPDEQANFDTAGGTRELVALDGFPLQDGPWEYDADQRKAKPYQALGLSAVSLELARGGPAQDLVVTGAPGRVVTLTSAQAVWADALQKTTDLAGQATFSFQAPLVAGLHSGHVVVVRQGLREGRVRVRVVP